MTQHRRSQIIGLFMVVVFSAVFLWALAAVVWPLPVAHADGPPEILTITVTSGLETYFYDPGLDPTGGTVYFNSVGGEGGGQVITVTTAVSGSIPITLTGAAAFGMTPTPDTNSTSQLSITYTIGVGAGTENGVLFTVTDSVGLTDTAFITFTQDNTEPVISSPSIYDFESPWLHVDDLSVYYGDDMTLPQSFLVQGQSTDDTGAGLDRAEFSEAFGGTPSDDPTPSTWAGTYHPYVEDWGDGTITVTVSDKVSNSAIQVFTYTRDIISPTIVPTIITETSPYLHADGLTLYYSDLMGGSAQEFEVQGTASDDTEGAGFRYVTFSTAFGDSLPPVTTTLWSGIYDVVSSDSGDGNIQVTAYDNVGNWSTGVFTYVEDLLNPTVMITDVTDPGYDSVGDELDDDGSNWYNVGDFVGSNWVFTSTTGDGGAGLASGSAFWDHSTDSSDRTIDCGPDGDGTFSPVSGDAEGTVTVTVTITDSVGNSASDLVVFNIDNTEPTIASPYISEGSAYLYADGLTIYYGDDMDWAQTFTVNGHSSDDGGVGLNVTDTVDFSPALWDNPSNSGTQEDWSGEYSASSGNTTSGQITVTSYDLLDNPATQVFTYTRDTGDPTVYFTDVTDPDYDLDGNELNTTGNWYRTGGLTAGWAFTSTVSDSGSGPGLADATWDHSMDNTDRSTDPGIDGDGVFTGVVSDGDGAVTVTLTITDNVGNAASDMLVIQLDGTAPSVPGNFSYLDDTDSGGDGFPPEIGYYDDTLIDLEWDPSTDDGSDLLTYHLGTAPQPTGGSYAEDSSYDVVSSGTYTIYLTAEDNVGNISDDTVTEPVVVDLEAPQMSSMNCPSGTGQLSFPVSWSGSANDPGSGLRSTDPYSVWYNVDGGGWQPWIIGTSAVMATFGPDSPVPVEYEHTYCFLMRAVDRAGNVEYTSGSDCTEVSEDYKSGQVFLPIIMAPDPNWGFELGNFAQWQHGGELAQSVSTAMPYSGTYSALLGSPSYACYNGVPVGSAWLRRTATVPSSGSPTLRFWYRIYTQDQNPSEPWEYDYFAVNINASEVFTDSNTTYTADCTTYDLGWKEGIVSLAPYTETVVITFYNYNRPDKHYNTYTYVDDVSVQ